MPSRPSTLAVGPNDHLYVADPTRNQILERLANGRFIVAAGIGKAGFSGDGGPAVRAAINDPGGMAFGPDGTLYFADQGNHRVRAISPEGTIRTVAGNGQPTPVSEFGGFVANGRPGDASIDPDDVTIGPNDLLYIATGEQVLRLDTDGTLAVVVGANIPYGGVYGVGGPATDASADGVDGIAFDSAGDLWMFGFNTKAILMVTPGGVLIQPSGDQNVYCRGEGGLVTAPSGAVIAMNELSVVRLANTTPDQTVISFYPRRFHGITGFSPDGIAVGSDGTIYVDTYYGNGFTNKSAIATISPTGSSSQIVWEARSRH